MDGQSERVVQEMEMEMERGKREHKSESKRTGGSTTCHPGNLRKRKSVGSRKIRGKRGRPVFLPHFRGRAKGQRTKLTLQICLSVTRCVHTSSRKPKHCQRTSALLVTNRLSVYNRQRNNNNTAGEMK